MIKIFRSTVHIHLLMPVLILASIFSPTTLYAQNSTCFDKITIEPSFIGFTTDEMSELARWYQAIFGLDVVKEFSFPNGIVDGVLMNKGEFIVEIFHRKDALLRSDYAKSAQPERWQGVMKFGVFTNADLPTLKQCLREKGVEAGRIFKDVKLNIDLLQVVDPEQNIIELISRTN